MIFDYKRLRGRRWIPFIFWVCAVVTIVVHILIPVYIGWDLDVYKTAIESLKAGRDPYVDAVAVQRAFYAGGPYPPGTPPPLSYVYPPITLPLLALAGRLPLWFAAAAYWILTGAAVIVALLVNWWTVGARERKIFAFLFPAALFFPGLIQSDVIFSGNLAYILYGLVFCGAWIGWTRGRWALFYAAVLVASCFKAPMLSLAAIAPLSSRRQWLCAGITVMAGVGIFVIQPYIWPELFGSYLETVELQLNEFGFGFNHELGFNHEFGFGPAGILASAFYDKVPYQLMSVGAYILCASAFGALLLFLRRRWLDGRICLKQWIPVMLCGVILLSPRVKEYDVAQITMIMALVLWRALELTGSTKSRAVAVAVIFVLANVIGNSGDNGYFWHVTESLMITGTFLAGCWDLARRATGIETQSTL